jgi:23S rRNA (cytidine1920-2'-O)/16S rRNA (cytidine1409-2'-O)-methyltransferase
MRLDNYLVENGFVESRTKAQNIIKNALVHVDGKVVKKSSYKVGEDDKVEVTKHKSFVSRSAHKLDKFLDELELDITGFVALDIGSSTGGFTQVLLEYGAKKVYALTYLIIEK